MSIVMLITIAICFIGCIWAHIPVKKTVLVLLIAPIVAAGSFFMLIAAAGFLTLFLAFLLDKLGINIDRFAENIAWGIASLIVATLFWIYFSNEREINLRTQKKTRHWLAKMPKEGM